ncbi:peptide chain release factor 1 [Caminibacter mediatlanticus TB-2]|uniref:Peptide chain release factor 1 n=1 Tax=Caminibacter mediatlanticus TB-2 TaxID=391592 RepID=A0ABX5VCT6_9BACT|nr:peptide chain release factor 1 [Caminibacter mediatlanticus]QCT94496.1 peptide chain release factor 1 [Caminibacter mediatlanticus TB-2]
MLIEKLKPFVEKYNEINQKLSSPEITKDIKQMTKLSREARSLEEIVNKAKEYEELLNNLEEAKMMLDDAEMSELAKEEIKEIEEKLPKLEEKIKLLLLPKDPNDDKNIFLEIRAGTGGDEAALFVGDLMKAYLRYADNKGWKVEIVSESKNDIGGYKEIILLIKGEGAYSRLKYEGGTHRVQRIPATESQGRIHTSAVTVAVMPEVDDVDIELDPKDIKIEVMRAGGAGGQHVNKTESAVRMTHIPTGITVSMQDERSQQRNKEKALQILKARVYEKLEKERLEKIGKERKSQVGSGDRSERIRTYNYPQNRITDHRIGLTLYRLEQIMNEGLFDEIIDPLIAHYQAEALKEAGL